MTPRCWHVGGELIHRDRQKTLSAFPALFIVSFNRCLCFQDVVLGKKTSPLADYIGVEALGDRE